MLGGFSKIITGALGGHGALQTVALFRLNTNFAEPP
jgi:hypothetical protein